MMNDNLTVENLVLYLGHWELLDGAVDYPTLDPSDKSLISSFCTQIRNGLGFTDRQFELAKRKIEDYRDQFAFLDLLDEIKERTSLPVRDIDRSRWIRIVENKAGHYDIAVRFTFQKKLISAIEELQRKVKDKGNYDKIEKIHYFNYSEYNLYEIVNAFEGKNFELDDTVKTIYDKLSNFKHDDYLPGVYNYEIKNLHPNGKQMLLDELGEPTPDNLLLYRDRHFKYGLSYLDNFKPDNSLASKIACRKHPTVSVNSDNIKIDELLLTLEQLERFPALILVPSEHSYDAIVALNQYIRNIISAADTSVTFRMDNVGEGIDFNNYIRDQQINNKVDTNTKVVYNLDNKVPKPLISSEWNPRSIIVIGNIDQKLYSSNYINTRKVLDCFTDIDLIIHYTDSASPGANRYYRREIDKL